MTESGKSPARVAEPESGFEAGQTHDHVDAINQVFAEFEFAYHNQFHKAFASAESLVIAKKYWLSSLEHFTPRQIVQAAKQVIRRNEYLPSISVLLKACEQGYDLFGLPSPRQAYVEACAAPSPKREFDWSHDAVYCAGRAAGWYLLATEAEAVAFPVFEYHYRVLCERVMNGEELEREAPPALPDKVQRPLSREETRA
ncbi:MAG: replication protein P, partial [Pseudohongiellaceae bacterium]